MTHERLYVASKTIHAPMWRHLRDCLGWPILSTWIDEAASGATSNQTDLAHRCLDEPTHATGMIVYVEPNERLKGALVEAGAALAAGVPVAIVGDGDETRLLRHHPSTKHAKNLNDAREYILQRKN